MGLFAFLSRTGFSLAIVAIFVAPPALVEAGLLVNEIYYDHPGSDAGHEFVELFNASGDTISLAGASLEFHNGVGVGWSQLWQGSESFSVAPGALFVVGGSDVRPSPDIVTSLSLQNGPDAIRVTLDGAPTDVVGYGGLEDPSYVEIVGAAPVPSGSSLGRREDGVDTNNNAADFTALMPSPGALNVPRRDVAVMVPPSTPVRAPVDGSKVTRLVVHVSNGGKTQLAAQTISVGVTDSTFEGRRTVGRRTIDRAVPPGAFEVVSWDLTLTPGYHWVTFTATTEGDERPHNNNTTLVRRVGDTGLLVSEVLSFPDGACPQFVELFNASFAPVSVTGFSIRDRTHKPVPLSGGMDTVPARGFLVVTEDVDGLRDCYPSVAALQIFGADGAWPTFNRSGGEEADSVVLLDTYGVIADAISYPGLASGYAGRSLERVNLYSGGVPVFLVSTDPAGATPGRPGARSIFEPVEKGTIAAQPNPFYPDAGQTLQISIDAEAGVASAKVAVFDLRGVETATVASTSVFPAVVVWDGMTEGGQVAEPGFYVVACEFYDASGMRVRVAKLVVATARGG